MTPFVSAKRVADALGDSAILIEQDDYGVSKCLDVESVVNLIIGWLFTAPFARYALLLVSFCQVF